MAKGFRGNKMHNKQQIMLTIEQQGMQNREVRGDEKSKKGRKIWKNPPKRVKKSFVAQNIESFVAQNKTAWLSHL